MNTTRDQILNTIRARGQASVAELAQALGISTVSVRHHLSVLQAEGMLSAAEVRRGVGRPHLSYTLTEAALERFPTKYVRLSERLLNELKATLPPGAIEAIFTHMAEGIVSEYTSKLAGKTIDEKMGLLVEMLGAEGFMAGWNRSGETISLTEYNCPYIRIGQRHPEVCAIDRSVISQVLAANVQKTTCMLNGADHCVYVITPGTAQPIPVDSISPPGELT